MSQNNIIAGALIFAFIMFITMRGELPKYLALFQKSSGSQSSGSVSSSGSGGGFNLQQFLNDYMQSSGS